MDHCNCHSRSQSSVPEHAVLIRLHVSALFSDSSYFRGEGMAAVKAYGTYYSPNAARAFLVLHEKDVEFELVRVSILEGEHKTPEYLALQPFGLVPLLQDGDFKVFESRAIMRYVADKYKDQGTPNLYGSTLEERAQVEQWLEVENGAFSPTAQMAEEQLFHRAFDKIAMDPKVLEESTEKMAKILGIYEAQLSKHKYLAGDFVSLADLAHLPFGYIFFHVAEMKPELLSSRKHVAAWWQAISSRPAWKKIVSLADWESWQNSAKSS